MTTKKPKGDGQETTWLVLFHQFPQDPGSLRVRIWRRLQSIGAVAVRNSMYVLPLNEQAREDFEWILRELLAGAADGAILESKFVGGMSDSQIRGLFAAARDTDYVALAGQVREAQKRLPRARARGEERAREVRKHLARFRKRLSEIEAIDFFGSEGRLGTAALLEAFAKEAGDQSDGNEPEESDMTTTGIEAWQGRVWVTRADVHVDRIATAWLVRRWIDPDARFRFTTERQSAPDPGEVRFDMFDAEFTHEGERCTFEVLLARTGLEDPALRRVGEIVHDLDLKDHKYDHEETPGIGALLAGLFANTEDDAQRLERGGAIFDDLWSAFRAGTK